VLEILTGSPSAYSYNPDEPISEYPHAVGRNTLLMGGLQARNNARVIISGSLEMFSDNFFTASLQRKENKGITEPTGNRDFSLAVSNWCFQHSGVLRLHSVKHHSIGQEKSSRSYTVNEDAIFSVIIERFSLEDGHWLPYKAEDVQLELVRIDPFLRLNLTGDSQGKFEKRFKIPDVYGVFQFKVVYYAL